MKIDVDLKEDSENIAIIQPVIDIKVTGSELTLQNHLSIPDSDDNR